ncbi:hypothetical protein EDD11_010334 [Mortierella claussenii]|nr:hypothetical protein EDD11_010334 [Mortierella claussenii]
MRRPNRYPNPAHSEEMLSHEDTVEMHFGRISRELGGAEFVEKNLHSMERNVILQRFVKPISPLAPSVLLQEFGQYDFLDEDDDQDIDFHVGRALDIPITNHPRQLRTRKEVAYYVDEIPSSPLEESYASDTEVEVEETK